MLERYYALLREYERNPERVKEREPLAFCALSDAEPRMQALRDQLGRERGQWTVRRDELEGERDELRLALTKERRERLLLTARSDQHEARARDLERKEEPATLTFEAGEREKLMELGWRKAI